MPLGAPKLDRNYEGMAFLLGVEKGLGCFIHMAVFILGLPSSQATLSFLAGVSQEMNLAYSSQVLLFENRGRVRGQPSRLQRMAEDQGMWALAQGAFSDFGPRQAKKNIHQLRIMFHQSRRTRLGTSGNLHAFSGKRNGRVALHRNGWQ